MFRILTCAMLAAALPAAAQNSKTVPTQTEPASAGTTYIKPDTVQAPASPAPSTAAAAKSHEKWIELQSYQFGVSRCAVSQAGGPAMLVASVSGSGGDSPPTPDMGAPIGGLSISSGGVKKPAGGASKRTAGETAVTDSGTLGGVGYGAGPHVRLTFEIGQSGPDGGLPTVTAVAIKAKASGAENNRQAAPPATSCDGAGRNAREQGAPAISEMTVNPKGGKASCTMRMINNAPVFDIALPLGDLTMHKTSANGNHIKSAILVPHGARPDLPTLAACTSSQKTKSGYDLKLATKV